MNSALYSLPILIQVLYCNCLTVTKCKFSDSECLKASAITFLPTLVPGIKEVNTDPIDPMHVDEISIDLSGLKMVLSDVVINGLKDAKIQKLSLDMEKKEMKLIFNSDFIMNSHYRARGRLLVLPITGDGDANIKINNLAIDLLAHFVLSKNSNGKDVINLKSFTYKYELKDGFHIKLTNLFNGNKELSDAMHKFIDENWKPLSEEFGKPIIDGAIKVLFKNIRKFLKSQPLADISLS